ncbi:MAG: OmpH family outer membrane protein, partial [Planctomycetia bacterium]
QKLKAQGTNLDGQLKEIKDKLQSQVTAKEHELKQMGQQVTPEQKKQLVGMLQAANSQYDLAKRKAIAVVQQQKAVMIQQFRKEAIDVAREVAKSKGFDMVIAKNPTVVLSYDSSFDITEAVIEAMPAAPAAEEEPQQEVATQVAQTNENSYR